MYCLSLRGVCHATVSNLIFCLKDPRYNDEVDRITGYKAESLLCMPIRNADDEVVAVAQVINKSGSNDGFTKEDEKVSLLLLLLF